MKKNITELQEKVESEPRFYAECKALKMPAHYITIQEGEPAPNTLLPCADLMKRERMLQVGACTPGFSMRLYLWDLTPLRAHGNAATSEVNARTK